MNHLTNNVFSESRKKGDIDLVHEITQLLSIAGHPSPELWALNPTINEAKTASPKLQQFLINRYWRVQLGRCIESTTSLRYCLDDDAPVDTYLNIFMKVLVPAILRNNLPKPD
jgi:hypothetical protein